MRIENGFRLSFQVSASSNPLDPNNHRAALQLYLTYGDVPFETLFGVSNSDLAIASLAMAYEKIAKTGLARRLLQSPSPVLYQDAAAVFPKIAAFWRRRAKQMVESAENKQDLFSFELHRLADMLLQDAAALLAE